MRSYIFTAAEREVIRRFLEGKTASGNMRLIQIRHRMRAFGDLKNDVELYMLLKKKIEI